MLESDIYNLQLPCTTRRQLAKEWLRKEQRSGLSVLRTDSLLKSIFYNDVTLVTYTFPFEESDFDFIEFAIRYSWRCLGYLKTVIVADRNTDVLRKFCSDCHQYVSLQIEQSLRQGDIASMSCDCIEKLHSRFQSPYCLIIQDDGFPLNGNLDEFLWKYDFLGAPTCRDVPAQSLVDLFRCACLNGGFSLRSKRICEAAAREWRFFRHFIKIGSTAHAEDVFYTKTACLNPIYRFGNKFPSSKVARRFSIPDFDGVVDIRSMRGKVFGAHGHTALWQLLPQPIVDLAAERTYE